MSASSTYYDQVASVVPGSLGIGLFSWIFWRVEPSEWLAAGATGLAVIAFGGLAVGFLLTHLGHWFSAMLWQIQGRPTDECRKQNNKLLREPIRIQLIQQGEKILGTKPDESLVTWQAFVRICMSSLSRRQNTVRMDLFLAQFSLARNLFLLAVIFVLYSSTIGEWALFGAGMIFAITSFSSMQFFDRRYASEIFVAYFDLISANGRQDHK